MERKNISDKINLTVWNELEPPLLSNVKRNVSRHVQIQVQNNVEEHLCDTENDVVDMINHDIFLSS